MTKTIKQILHQTTASLKPHSDSARLDAEILLAHVLKKNRVYLIAHSHDIINDSRLQTYDSLIQQRLKGMPIAYIVGHQEFWSLPLKVSSDTLIPRPETELLVSHALDLLPVENTSIIDLGTGSGAIAIALATERPNWTIIATDKSKKALKIAKENAKKLEIKNIEFIQSSWFDNVPKQYFDAVISNPPYIPQNDCHLSQGDVRFEPQSALVSGDLGLDDIQHIATQSKNYLNNMGRLMLEHGYNQKGAVHKILSFTGYQCINTLKDYQGHDRITVAKFLR